MQALIGTCYPWYTSSCCASHRFLSTFARFAVAVTHSVIASSVAVICVRICHRLLLSSFFIYNFFCLTFSSLWWPCLAPHLHAKVTQLLKCCLATLYWEHWRLVEIWPSRKKLILPTVGASTIILHLLLLVCCGWVWFLVDFVFALAA